MKKTNKNILELNQLLNQKLLTMQFKSMAIKQKIVLLASHIAPILEAINVIQKELINEYVKKDDKGRPIKAQGLAGNFELIPEKAEEYMVKFEEFLQISHDLTWVEIDLDAIKCSIEDKENFFACLTASDLMTLNGFIKTL